MISSLLFDFGGTLDGDGLHWLDRFYAIYAQIGLQEIPRQTIKEAFYWADERAERDQAMRSCGLRPMMEKHVHWQYEKLGRQDASSESQAVAGFVRPAERVLHRNRHLLEKLRTDGLKLGVISNFYGNVETLCREFGFLPHLQAVLDSALVGLRKPDPQFYRLALEKLKSSPEQTVMIGDSFERDIVPAKTVGMRTLWLVGDRPRTPPDSRQADGVIHSLEDLPAHLAGLKGTSR